MLNKPIPVLFFRSESGNEPVREWLRDLEKEERKQIGNDIKTIQFGWPIGMPMVRKLDTGLWEVRSRLKNKISRIIFSIYDDKIALLHGFIKKSQKTPKTEMKIAMSRKQKLEEQR